ncbi:MAG: glutamate--tRNA ligase [Rickettsiaceae bacterium]|nr:glutamate--tRNA ligase [Rickettsiaceae bacterium]
MNVITRFAPSPTGYLHIGSARTALFNYLFARHFGGKFLLRIEDTDSNRSTLEATNAIFEGLEWLGIKHDDKAVFQSKNTKRYKQVALELLNKGAAYKCFMTQEEVNAEREKCIKEGRSFLLDSKWRDATEAEHPKNQAFVIRIKAPRSGDSIIHDIIQGQVTTECSALDDMVLLRSDGTPTYMLAVVVDDHDMKITHIIRGDDHLNNAFRQKIIYEAMNWQIPIMGHIPLIHGQDGAKLSKRHGALGVNSYKEMGYLPEALNNYLMRLGWSYGDEEIISIEESIKRFDGSNLGKSPARIDFAKMDHINGIYIRNKDDESIIEFIINKWQKEGIDWDGKTAINIKQAIGSIKTRSSRMLDAAELAKLYHSKALTLSFEEEAVYIIQNSDTVLVQEIIAKLLMIDDAGEEDINSMFKQLAKEKNMKLGELMKIVRAFLTGKTSSPSLFELIAIIGPKEASNRIKSKMVL